MWQRCDVFDSRDLQSCVLQVQNGLFAAGAGAVDLDLDLDHARLAGLLGSVLGGASGGVGSALARALEVPALPGRRPRDRLAVGVGDGDHRVVEGRLDVRDAARHAFADRREPRPTRLKSKDEG